MEDDEDIRDLDGIDDMDWMNSSQYQRECDRVPLFKERQTQKMKRQYRHANRDSLRLNSRRNMINREHRVNHFLTEAGEVKRMTNYPDEVFEGILHHNRIGHVIEERLALIGETRYSASWALLETMYYLASGATYKRTADMFANGSFRQARVIRVVQRLLAHRVMPPSVISIVYLYVLLCRLMPGSILYPSQLPTDARKWLAYEQAMFVQFQISHVMMIMDVYECPVASSDIHYRNDKGQFVIKFLVVMAPTDEIIHLSCWAGSLTNQVILQSSSFGQSLMDPTNPLNIPQNLRFRGTDVYATPTCLADGDWSVSCPFLLVCPHSESINYCRLAIERFFGRFTAINRFLLSYVLVENQHQLVDMIFAAIGIWNFRVAMEGDSAHVHTVVCYHHCDRFFDESRVVNNVRMRDGWNNRITIMRYHGIEPRMPTLPLFDNPGTNDGFIDIAELEQFVLVEAEIHHPFGMERNIDPRFIAYAAQFQMPVDGYN